MSENLMPHIRLPKDLDVDCVLLPGDPARADTVASHLEDARLLASNREFRSWQGTYKGKKMLVTSTGIGAASCAIAVEELIQCGVHNLIRIGSCGALQPECALGDLIFVTGAIRDDGTSAAYVEAQYPAIPDFDLLSACRESAVAENIPYHLGICRSHSCLYGDRRDTYDRLYTEGASLAGFGAGDEVKAIDILYGVMLPSGAECCVGLAQHLFGSEENFVAKMNEKAAELGMDSTHFVTCTGLHDENHYTTVRDLTKLLSYALQNDTFRQIYCTSEYTTSATASAPEGLHFLSTMFKKMDSPEVNGGEIEGGKTGYTGEAGQCLASLAKVDDVEYILVTAGAPGGPSTEPYHIEDAKAVYNRIQAGEQGSAADTAADSQDDQATTETDGAA